MSIWNLERVIEACRGAAAIALRYYDDPPMELKADLSVVTAADKEIEAYLTEFLTEGNDSFFIGEESFGSRGREYVAAALKAPACWVVDPIDGTAPYSCGFPAWGHSIALLEHGRATEGALYLPVQDRLLITDGDVVWHYRDLRDPAKTVRERFVFSPATGTDVRRPIALAQTFAKYGRVELENQVFCWSACVAACYYLLTGKLLAYVAVVKLWDIAAMAAILTRGSCVGVDAAGKLFDNEVSEALYWLDPTEASALKLREPTCFAADRGVAEFIFSRIKE